jgi:hypothetical protein
MAKILTQPRSSAEPVTEKLGNTVWVACPKCATAFPVSPALAGHATAQMHCPACHNDFNRNDA